MDAIIATGLLAGALTTASLFPQLAKIWRTKSAEDVSTGMFVTFCIGVVLWLVYGIANRDVAVIAANAITLVLAIAILVLKFKYARNEGSR